MTIDGNLGPCAKCGGEAARHTMTSAFYWPTPIKGKPNYSTALYYVECVRCKASTRSFSSRAEADAAWKNGR